LLVIFLLLSSVYQSLTGSRRKSSEAGSQALACFGEWRLFTGERGKEFGKAMSGAVVPRFASKDRREPTGVQSSNPVVYCP
jgi:hypothetical protein